MLFQVNYENLETEVILRKDRISKLKELLPERWQDKY